MIGWGPLAKKRNAEQYHPRGQSAATRGNVGGIQKTLEMTPGISHPVNGDGGTGSGHDRSEKKFGMVLYLHKRTH
ncbi:hypothetical protein AA0114_g473 [Alternaria tenuissima]|uniref:Uncharacterized protein n=1 Tax=Alternaria tenuissima TaxID=119927 RepID=A0A4Q4MX29_9PLEO|nr:hypothetical protein AA0114_g473 [Alternaria tenuissima]